MFIVKPSMWYSAVLVTCRSISRLSGQSARWKLPSYISSRNSRSIALTTWGSYQTPHQSFRQWRRQWSCPMRCQRMCRRSIGFTFCSIARRCWNLRLSLKHMVAKICLSQKHVWFPRYWAGEWLVLFCLVGCSLVFFFQWLKQKVQGCIIAGLIKLEEFAVDEEVLWSQLLKWSANAVRNAELLGPFADATGDREKRLKNDCPGSEGLGMNELAQQGAILEMISRHIRFAAMSKTFFFDKARTYLTRDHCDAVIAYFLLNRKSGELLTSKREVSPEELLVPPFLAVQQCGPNIVSDDISRLVTGSGSWTPTREKSCLMVELKEMNLVTRVELTFSPQGVVWPCTLQCRSSVEIEIETLEVKGRTQSCTRHVRGKKLYFRPQYPNGTANANLEFIRKAAAVTSIKVFGMKKDISEVAKEVVQCKAEELLACTTAPSIPMNGTDGEASW